MGTQGVRSLGGMRSHIIWWYTLAGSDGEPTFTGMRAPDHTGQTEMSGGGDARQRAIRYADREYGAFDEIRARAFRRRTRWTISPAPRPT